MRNHFSIKIYAGCPGAALLGALLVLTSACATGDGVTDKPQRKQAPRILPKAQWPGALKDVAWFAEHKSDRFIADMKDVTGGSPFKGKRAVKPHGGAHAYFEGRKPAKDATVESYPRIYAPMDGVIARVTLDR